MTIEQIRNIFESTKLLPIEQRSFAFREGMLLLFDLHDESDLLIDEGYGQFWYGNVNEVLPKLTPEKCMYLAERCWTIEGNAFVF